MKIHFVDIGLGLMALGLLIAHFAVGLDASKFLGFMIFYVIFNLINKRVVINREEKWGQFVVDNKLTAKWLEYLNSHE